MKQWRKELDKMMKEGKEKANKKEHERETRLK